MQHPETAREWLNKWDNNEIVWSIEMGGFGPGYEQCIQKTCAEIIRFLIEKEYDLSLCDDNDELAKQWNDEVFDHTIKHPDINHLGITGAQFGAANNLAFQLHRNGPRAVMNDEELKDRLIQVKKNFP